jgi:hypothetical protein
VSAEIHIQPYEVLNRFFEEKLADTSLYSSNSYSFLKVFQHALTYEQAGTHNRIIRNYLHWPLPLHRALLQVKSVVRKKHPPIHLRDIVFIDPARLVCDSSQQWHSIYMERVASFFEADKVSLLNRKTESRLACQVSLDSIPRSFGSPDNEELRMLSEVDRVAKKTLQTDFWTDIQKQHILSALHVFFDDFRFYYSLFKNQRVQSLVFICHYHNEGLLAALRINGIRSIELQHGLISKNDLYYHYSQTFNHAIKNAFFPDHICVYGQYWKELLLGGCEFNSNNITVAGDYQWHEKQPEIRPSKQNMVLICAQKNMHEDFVAYAKHIIPYLKQYGDWKWIIKMHPLEKKKSLYRELENDGFEIIDQERSLDSLLQEARIQVSIYSTTFFDALGYDITNFSIQRYGVYQDYAAKMVEEGVAHPLRLDENPIEKHDQLKGMSGLRNRQEVYGPLDADALRNAISGKDY